MQTTPGVLVRLGTGAPEDISAFKNERKLKRGVGGAEPVGKVKGAAQGEESVMGGGFIRKEALRSVGEKRKGNVSARKGRSRK